MEEFDYLFWGLDFEKLRNCEMECQCLMKKYGISLEKYPEIPDEAKQMATDLITTIGHPFDELTEIIVYAKFMALLWPLCDYKGIDPNDLEIRVKDPYPTVYYRGLRL